MNNKKNDNLQEIEAYLTSIYQYIYKIQVSKEIHAKKKSNNIGYDLYCLAMYQFYEFVAIYMKLYNIDIICINKCYYTINDILDLVIFNGNIISKNEWL